MGTIPAPNLRGYRSYANLHKAAVTGGLPRRVRDAIIDDIMINLNHEAIATQRLAPDVVVTNKHDILGRKFVISSIREDGTVYLRGGNRAVQRSLHGWQTVQELLSAVLPMRSNSDLLIAIGEGHAVLADRNVVSVHQDHRQDIKAATDRIYVRADFSLKEQR